MFGRLSHRRRGAALLDALLALAVFAILATSTAVWLDGQRQDDIAVMTGRQTATLGAAAADYVREHYESNAAATWPSDKKLWSDADTELRDNGVLPAAFPTADAMRRDLRVWYRRIGTHPNHTAIQVLAGQGGFDAGGARIPDRALFQGRGRVRLGIVEKETGCNASGAQCRCPGTAADRLCLVGPSVAEDIEDFDGQTGSGTGTSNAWLSDGAVMAFFELTQEEYCGGLVMREASTVCPLQDLSALDMGGNALAGTGGDLKVGTSGDPSKIVIAGDMTASGAVSVAISGSNPKGGIAADRDFVVSGALTITGGGLAVYGNVEAGGLTVTNGFDVLGDLDIVGKATVTSVVDVGDDMTVKDTNTSTDENLNVGSLRVDNCTGC